MNTKIKKFLKFGFIIEIIISITVFLLLASFMTRKTKESVSEVSKIYMSEMNMQIQQKFESIIDLRTSQVAGIIERTPPDNLTECDDDILDELKKSAQIRDFIYLGFYGENGKLEKIYGNDVQIVGNTDIKKSLNKDGDVFKQGVDENGNKILLLGKAAEYPMKDGNKSIALIAGISMEYLDEALFLTTNDSMIYTYIIDESGNFVIRGDDVYKHNYFERIKDKYEDFEGKNSKDYIREIKEAMKNNESYFANVLNSDGEKQIYCSPISESSKWYLINVMPKGILDETISELDSTRMVIMFSSLIIILVTIIVIFFKYHKLMLHQMEELDAARKEAIHANGAKSEFLASMSHDIRTPMNAIVGMTNIALKNINDPVRLEDCLKKVKLSGKHLIGLINDVLDMSKIESGKLSLNMAPISLRETMDDIVNIMQPQVKEKNQYFDIFIDKIEVENVICDSVRLNQVLLNILSNAVKYTQKSGTINVFIYQEPSPKGDDYIRVHFRISDNGFGMSEDFQKKIFESFSREETEHVQNTTGTGLGMAITKYIVDLMGGTIELKSELRKGSEFHVTLDLKKTETKEEDMKLPAWNVLVVDDNKQLCISAVSNLEELGVCAEWTLDGEEAVHMVEKRHKENNDYHFVLLDWRMPKMDGLQTIKEIRKRVGKKIPIFLISAYDWSDIENEVNLTEIEGFISKPLFKSTLYSRLCNYMTENKEKKDSDKGQEIDFSGKRILLAEDNDINWEIANEILMAVGLEIERAVNGQVCVDKFEESSLNFYDAILMDIRMPVMNGYDATRNIRKSQRADKDLPIIAMTADAFSDDVQCSLDCGMNAHIAKPIDISELMRTLQKYL